MLKRDHFSKTLAIILLTTFLNFQLYAETPLEKKVPDVYVEEVKEVETFDESWFFAELSPSVYVPILSEINGRIVKWHVKPGQKIEKGQKVVSVKPWASAMNSNQNTIHADESGILGSHEVAEGSPVKESQGLTTIWEGSRRNLLWKVSKSDLLDIKPGMKVEVYQNDPQFQRSLDSQVEVEVDQIPHDATAEVLAVSTIEDTAVGGFQVQATIDCAQSPAQCEVLPVRSWTKVRLKKNVRKVLQVAKTAYDPTTKKVFVIENGSTVAERAVVVGQATRKRLEVKEGLKAGEIIVVSYGAKPKNGLPVKIVEKDKKPEEAPKKM